MILFFLVVCITIVAVFCPRKIDSLVSEPCSNSTECTMSYRDGAADSFVISEADFSQLVPLIESRWIQYSGPYRFIKLGTNETTYELQFVKRDDTGLVETGNLLMDEEGNIYTKNSKYRICFNGGEELLNLLQSIVKQGDGA